MSSEQFWDSSIRELTRELVIGRHAALESHNRDVMQAHLIAGLSRTKRLPPLKRLLVPVDAPRPSRAGLRAALHVLSEQTGIPLRRVSAVRHAHG